ncbi:YbhB/YbcL family Raf kinase inhibitor-like protein [Methanobacterium sp.]|jgi:Raf kinase inhibitor-like YbhB/YbcL family protein|uniref:YbhB/YbcL family Raf kinase inhibitor-like protein n=1 Tax=Methanobacterium sp. TaxID=2164 RepID=UPI0031597024
MGINLMSDVFEEGDIIPTMHTCDDKNISPPLRWDSLPERTMSFAILCEDPDAPRGTWTHWIIFNILPSVMELSAGIKNEEKLSNGMTQGINDFGYAGYGGPCPPEGEKHRYFFRIYALDTTLNLSPGANRKEFLRALNENVLDEGQLMGIYGR